MTSRSGISTSSFPKTVQERLSRFEQHARQELFKHLSTDEGLKICTAEGAFWRGVLLGLEASSASLDVLLDEKWLDAVASQFKELK